jgi:hypothetical protein
MMPTGVERSFSSVRIRQSTGKALKMISIIFDLLENGVLTVIAIATPTNSS